MYFEFGSEFIEELPLILAGPMLQHTDSETVTVWVALKQSCQVELKVYDTTNNGATLGNSLLEGQGSTVALGKYLHIVAVTAQSENENCLVSDYIYAYDLQFTLNEERQTLSQALVSPSFPTVNISYFEHEKPTFALCPSRLQDLKIVHASCRKPHGHGMDALPILDCLIEVAANQPQHRPHQLFLSGDQIYGDDVSDPYLWVATNLGDALLGWEERLPVSPTYLTPKQLLPGERAEVATEQAGFTAGLHNKPSKVNSHLLGLGEYYAAYLLTWSPVCWPRQFPQGKEVTSNRKTIKKWNQEVRDLQQFIYTLGKVRRALANIPMYTIFDDHDVSDDWNLNQAWCLRVLGKPLGRRVVQNAMLAYAVFQAWGNTPAEFAVGKSGAKLLAAAQAWSVSQGTDIDAEEAIALYVGLPAIDPPTGLPTFVPDFSVLVLARHPESLNWHYTVRSPIHEVIVLDTRTWRGYPADQKPIAPPRLLSPHALKQQLLEPLQQTANTNIQATFVIAPTNVFGLKVIDWVHHWHLQNEIVFATDVGDAWNIHTEALAQFLSTLFDQRQQVIVLSGDIHYSSVVRLSHQRRHSQSQSVLVQLTCSALKNEELLTRLIHTKLKDWLLPEKVRYWLGWNNPDDMVEVSAKQWQSDRLHHPNKTSRQRQQLITSDWHCALELIPCRRTQTADFSTDILALVAPWNRPEKSKWRSLQPLMFWKARWFQDGKEVIGVNNIALVQFELTDESHVGKVIQDLYWFSAWYKTELVYSRFESPFFRLHSR
ncbi:PhoD-like phosphatase [Nostoc sp. FACHB-152]|uniref:PhoD-like phosphatase n=1 Tax=unclassified Nostoc TaxID=2593658 RepID=UPI00168204E4|nr:MULTISPECIES: PhoD-like phosphatase [unclassified Nostoc]MBD2445689.1 PhoD-like phosphatase [Nostoc sp. FACHB-152]MBD2466803.1 PhoD-like phosphatase [Nostoc sp. FACHB-145]